MTTSRDADAIELPGLPPIPGIRVRTFAGDDDWAPLAELVCAANLADDVPWLPSPDQLRIELGSGRKLDPAQDVVLVEVDGRLVASSTVRREVRDGVPTYEVKGSVDPAFRRRRIGTALSAWALARGRARAALEDPIGQVDLASWAQEGEVGNRALLEAAGFAVVRHFFLMRRDLRETVPDTPLPDGIDVRAVTRDQRRPIFDAENEAFRDHWGHHEGTDEEFQATYAKTELDTDQWVVAWAGDEIAGVIQNWVWPEENRRLGVRRGWLEHISVRRPWRRRGLARAMTATSLIRFRDLGLDEAMLGVDSENANGALGLYEGLGFRVSSIGMAYRRPLEREPAAS